MLGFFERYHVKLRLSLLAFSLAIVSGSELFAESLPAGLPSSVAITGNVAGKVLNYTATWDDGMPGYYYWDPITFHSVWLTNYDSSLSGTIPPDYGDVYFPAGQWQLELYSGKGDAFYMLTDPNGGLEFTTGVSIFSSDHATGLVTVGDRGFTDPGDASTFAVTSTATVPEPASLLSLAPAAAMGLLRRRRGASVAR